MFQFDQCRPGRILALGAVFALLGACALSGGTRVAWGSRVLVGLYDAHSDVVLMLANESHPDYRDAYSRRRPNANLKLAPEQAMTALLKEFEQAGFSLLAAPAVAAGDELAATWPASTRTPGTRGLVFVQRGQDNLTFELPEQEGDGGDALAAFVRMKFAMGELYQRASGLQLIDNQLGRDYFEIKSGDYVEDGR